MNWIARALRTPISERVSNLIGYARYLTHMDNSEKY
ncbi:MAG: hypothetical protein ABF975_08245 [Liquorilactobacillus hordei]